MKNTSKAPRLYSPGLTQLTYPANQFYITDEIHAPDGSPDLQCHTRLEIGYCYSGSGVFYIRDEMYPFNAGSITFVYPGELHDIRANSPQNIWRIIYADVPALFAEYPNKAQLIELVSGESYRGHLCDLRERHSLIDYILQIVHIYKCNLHHIEACLPYLSALLSCLLYETERLMLPEQYKNSYHNAPVELANQIMPAALYLQDHFTEQVRIMDLNALCYISSSHLRRGFSAVYGISPSEFMHQLRVNLACSLLSKTKDSILSVATQCGYLTVSSLNRQFQKFMHMTPMEYRKKYSDYKTSNRSQLTP